MRILNGANYIDLEVQLETDSSLPSCGDALIGVAVSSNGYTCKNQVWVAKQELDLFATSIRALDKYRKGEAVLSSMSPDELFLKVYAYDRVGHMAIVGKTGYQVTGAVGFDHSIEFGFTIEPEQVVKLSKAQWLTQDDT